MVLLGRPGPRLLSSLRFHLVTESYRSVLSRLRSKARREEKELGHVHPTSLVMFEPREVLQSTPNGL